MPCIMRLSVVIMHCVIRDMGLRSKMNELKFGLRSSCCDNESVMQMSASDYHHVSFALELIMLRSGLCGFKKC